MTNLDSIFKSRDITLPIKVHIVKAMVFPVVGLPWVTQTIKNLLIMWEAWVWSLVWEDPLEEGMASHSSILAWRIPRTEESGGLQSMGSQRVSHDCATELSWTELMFVIAFLPRSKHLLISCLQSLSIVIFEPQNIKSVTASTPPPSVCHEVMGLDAMILVFWMLSFMPAFSLSSFTLIKRVFTSSSLSVIRVYHLYIWGCWYFSWQSLF